MAPASEEPKQARRNLLDDSDSESDNGGAPVAASGFKVNEEFARRFEHNKKREERQRRMYKLPVDARILKDINKASFSGGEVEEQPQRQGWR